MLLSDTTYYILLVSIIVFLIVIYNILRRRKKTYGSIACIILAMAFFVFSKWIFPNVFIVSQCGTVKKEIMILPLKISGNTSIRYGKHCYLINQSDNDLYVETIFYGNENDQNSPKKTIYEKLENKTEKMYQVVALDYFFESPPSSIRTKGDGEIKYYVGCKPLEY